MSCEEAINPNSEPENLQGNLSEDSTVKVQEGRALNRLVRIAAGLVGFLLLIFFALVIQNAVTVSSQVEHIKDGPYPLSVAAGHIETNLVRLGTTIEHLSAAQHINTAELEQRYDNSFADTINSIQGYVDSLNPAMLKDESLYESFTEEFELLKSRLSVFTVMCWNADSGGDDTAAISEFANHYLYPVLSYLLDINDDILTQTTNEVNEMHDTVNAAVSTLIILTVIMMLLVAIMICIYILLLHARNKVEDELKLSLTKALQETREANESKSAFLSNMSHDIRTPMNAIVGLTAIADENIDDKLRVKQCLTRITTSSQHLLSLINDVLDMNKIESGKVVLASEEFTVNGLINEIETIIKSQPNAHRLDIKIEIFTRDREVLMGDTMRLRQILLNLTSNAIKYTNDGDTILISAVETPAEKKDWTHITFTVADTGIGMKRDFLDRIFEPFERERNDFTVFTEGTGLGMAITRNLVELMDGTIEIDSELGIGTTVTIGIDFPIARFDEVFADALNDEERANEGDNASLLKKRPVSGRVLIVEDNEINMEIAQTLVSARGADVECAADGLEAVKKFEAEEDGYYDLILMDWQMPHMNGIEATKAICRFIREHGRSHVPIVAMTANAFDSDRAEALEAGMDDFLAKPVNVRQLEEVLHRYLD